MTPEEWPALVQLLTGTEPFGCSECPFATAMYQDDYFRRPNIGDPDEGYYTCSLLDVKDIWGEQPKCETKHFRERALKELSAKGIVIEVPEGMLGWTKV